MKKIKWNSYYLWCITFLLFMLIVMFGYYLNFDANDATPNQQKVIKILNIYFVPSKEPEEIVATTKPLKELLKNALRQEGYDVEKIDILVGASYEAVGEALCSGEADVGFVPGGTYVFYENGAEAILTATRDGLTKDFESAEKWNDGKPTRTSAIQSVSYRGLFIAGPSKTGKELANKVNKDKKLTWEDLDGAIWSTMSPSSSSGYIYPSLWLKDKFGKGISDLSKVEQSDSYDSAFQQLASEQVDLLLTYADARRDYEAKWTNQFGRKKSIWTETNVIAVTVPIYNDAICVSKTSKIMNPSFISALQNAFIRIGTSTEGKKVIAVYNHQGYQVATSADYQSEREAQNLMKSLKLEKK